LAVESLDSGEEGGSKREIEEGRDLINKKPLGVYPKRREK